MDLSHLRHTNVRLLAAAGILFVPTLALAQSSPFATGANSLVSFALTIATPIAAIIVIGLAIAAAVGKISWGWGIGAIVGIAAILGARPLVTWSRGLVGVKVSRWSAAPDSPPILYSSASRGHRCGSGSRTRRCSLIWCSP